MNQWRPKTADIPDAPGVYMFEDAAGRVVYVGKAKSLKHRVPAYFGADLTLRTGAMVGDAKAVEWIVTDNEVEALQLEFTMIQQHRPRYNVRYRDDKSYPYLAVTLSEEFPRVMVMRGRKRKGNRYYGPYAHAYAIRETLDHLLRVFPIRSCSQGVFNRARRSKRPCLLYDIGRCSAPCVGHVDAEEHRRLIEDFCSFMDGDHDTVLKVLASRMTEASESLEFELAARIRDQISAVRKVIERQQMVWERKENVDVVAWHGDELEAAIQVFFVRGGRMVGRKGFIVDRVEDLSEDELLESFVENFYSEQNEVPKEVLVPVIPASREVLEDWLSLLRGSRVRIKVPERGSKRKLLRTVEENARDAFAQSRLKRAGDFAARSKALNDLQHHLDLPEAPLRIECFDVSNLGPTEVVGSMVVFEDALPKKSDYRKFKIRTLEGQDDVGAMGEMIERRFARFLEERSKPKERGEKFAYEPGLVVIDGGKGQLNRAVEVLSYLGVVGIPVIALAKRFEEVYLPGESEPRVIPRGSEALYLLQRIRNEAHRFAITYQRGRSQKRMTLSALDHLAGVGPTRRRALVKRFGSLKKLEQASAQEIAEVPGIGEQLAQSIYEQLKVKG
ncbi:MAG: excinuclease ABC subunit UvrC [Actinobacteria bacterium]|nr:excinuclease ABC subunit UvrC [Actinomycetota bacterium]